MRYFVVQKAIGKAAQIRYPEVMGQIKTALELALERTKDIQGDKASLEAKAFREKGMRMLAKAENDAEYDIAAELGALQGVEQAGVFAGIRQNLMNYLSLPSTQDGLERFLAVKRVFMALSTDAADMENYLGEVEGFFGKYLMSREQLLESLHKQLEGRVKQKEDQMARQTGRRVRINPETDPELGPFITKNLEGLSSQYSQVLDQVREEMRGLIGA